jgi:hypothetical protein
MVEILSIPEAAPEAIPDLPEMPKIVFNAMVVRQPVLPVI